MKNNEMVQFLPVVFLDAVSETLSNQQNQDRIDIAYESILTRQDQCDTLLEIYELYKGKPPAGITLDIELLLKTAPLLKTFRRVDKFVTLHFDKNHDCFLKMQNIKDCQMKILLSLLKRYKMSNTVRETVKKELIEWHKIGN